MHYYVPDLPEAVSAHMTKDWIGGLKEFPIWAIDVALAEWHRSNKRKPTIAEIRFTCNITVRQLRHWKRVLERCLKDPVVSDA